MIKAILFDLDGTLLDREASLKHFTSTQYQRFSSALQGIPKDKYISRFIELDCRGHVWKDKVYQSLVSEFSIQKLTWRDLLRDYENQFVHSCVPFAHLRDTLDILKSEGYLMGVITNGRGTFQTRTIQGLGVKNYFEVILISEIEGVRKPDAEIFNRALQKLGVTAEQSVFVGDHPTADVWGAMSVGMKAVWFRNSFWTEPADADAIIENLAMLPLIIQHFE